MMKLSFQNDKVCVYSMEDWKTLRQSYRIIGEFLGASQTIPTLPIALLPEEAVLLVKKSVIKIVHYPNLQNAPTQPVHDEYVQLQIDLLNAEQDIYKTNRKEALSQVIDAIVAGKKKKGIDISHESVLKDELDKVAVTSDKMVWPILTDSVESAKGIPVEVPLNTILKQTTLVKSAVFMDLWEKGYYITSGKKFGGDFLVYTGDPIAFHAIYIIRCVEDTSKEMHMSEIVAFGRLGTSVKKKAIMASLKDNNINYTSINWLEM